MKHMRKSLNYLLYLSVGFLIINLIWFILDKIVVMPALPEPMQVYASYPRAIKNGIFAHINASLLRVLAGLGISLIIAVLLGLAMGYNKRLNKILGPVVYLSFPVPKLALMPVIMIFFGIGELSKILIVVLIIVFQLTVSIRDAVLSIPKEDYDVFVSLNASAWDKIRHIAFPAVVPAMLSSLRVSTGIAISILIVVETYGTLHGLGFYLIDSWMRADYIQMYFGILVLSVLGCTIFMLFDAAEKYFCRWKDSL